MGSLNWLRTYMMTCADPKTGKGFVIGNTRNAEQIVLRVSFSVEKSDSETANNGKITVWNLSPENRKTLETKDCNVILTSGYDMANAIIIQGSVVSGISSKEDADIVTEVEVVDGRVALRDTVVTVSLNGVVDSKTLYDYVSKQMGVTVLYSPTLVCKPYPAGFSFVGKARQALDKITEYNGHKWTLQNGVLQITNPNEPISVKAYVLSSKTGLIGIPKRITLDDNKTKGQNQTGYEVSYLLNAAIGINDLVVLQTKDVQGTFRVMKIQIEGDNFESSENSWTCTAQIVAV